MKKYGYIRVSTKEQNPERQFIALKEQGIPEENILTEYQEKIFSVRSIRNF